MAIGLKLFAVNPEETEEEENETVFWSPAWQRKALEAAFTALLLTGIVAFNLLPVGTLPTMFDAYLMLRIGGITFLTTFALNMGVDYVKFVKTK